MLRVGESIDVTRFSEISEKGGLVSYLTHGRTRQLLRDLGLRPKRKLGQNFLVDGNIVRRAIGLAALGADDIVVEVGPGLGALTRPLLASGSRVFAVECDRRLCRHLAETIGREYPERFDILQADAVKRPTGRFREDPTVLPGSSFKVVASLPYAITTPWLVSLLSGPLPKEMVLLLQKEAADRITAPVGSKKLGAISIFFQSVFETEFRKRVSQHCFYPEPAVESVLIRFLRREEPHVFSKEARTAIRAIFSHRRKQFGTICRNRPDLHAWGRTCAARGVSPKVRPEGIPLELWRDLSKSKAESKAGSSEQYLVDL